MEINREYLRNFIFGVEDSLVSTIGLVSGIAAAGAERSTIILSGIVLIFVEAFSMGIGSLLSENSAQEYSSRSEVSLFRASGPALVMFVAYLLSGFIVIFPYLIFPAVEAFVPAIIISLIALFLLGGMSAKLSGTSLVRNGVTMSLVGGAAILIGIVVGSLVK